jgi:hypothetical protein
VKVDPPLRWRHGVAKKPPNGGRLTGKPKNGWNGWTGTKNTGWKKKGLKKNGSKKNGLPKNRCRWPNPRPMKMLVPPQPQ